MIRAFRPVVALAVSVLLTTALSRRTFAALASSVVAFLAGCLDANSATDRTPTNTDDTADTDTPTATSADHAEPDAEGTTALESIDSDAIERAEIRTADESEPWAGSDGLYGVRIANATDEPVQTTVGLTHNGDELLARELELPARGDVVLECSEGGRYELSAETAGSATETAINWEPTACATGTTELTVSASGISMAVSLDC
ncbi:hypothetical protein C483_01024 [Natrialba hulunbeirensis JCM 10989]|uniref:Uncharacterized protein n=1 Tax=Natrialba hulunbeirensis JCM 10989 TaxID=1227493 RepID=M0AAW6_9EURY|nr:hypothetical protein [Natrialba hulunbeirensis]ELY95684.1 hypothetical protein C483_01024 [Natrialba hulunbeirensis JCM 10989]